MEITHKKRKTRAQRKAFFVGIIASVLTVGFAIGSLISGLHLPKRDDLAIRYENNNLNSLLKGADESYYLTFTKNDENNLVINNYFYHYDAFNNLIEKHSLLEDAKEKFGIEKLNSIDGLYTCYESDYLFAVSSGENKNYLFKYEGLNSNDLKLVSYSDAFDGRIVWVTSNDKDIYVLSQNASQMRIDRYDANEEELISKASGYIYEINNRSGNYHLICSKNIKPLTVNVRGDYLYISTNTYIRRIYRDLEGINYRILFEKELASVKQANPTLEDKDAKELAKENCITNYGWVSYNYNDHSLELKTNKLSAEKFAFYLVPDLAGIVLYKDKWLFGDKQNAFYTYTLDELNDTNLVINYLEELLNYDDEFIFPYKLTNMPNANAFKYYGIGSNLVIFYEESTPMMSVLDLETLSFKYTMNVSTRVGDAIFNEKTGVFIYKYQDPVNREVGYNYLSEFVVEDELNSKIINILFIIFIIAAIVALIIAAIAWLSYFFKPVVTSVLRTSKGVKKHWPIYVILFPSVLLLGLFCYYPGIAAIFTSFFDYKAGVSNIKTWNNFANYVQIFGNIESLRHFANMILFLVADIVLSIVPPLIFAFFLTLMRHKKVSGILRTLLFIPGIIPGIAGLLIWRTGIYGDYGLINNIIKAAGGNPIMFFQQSDYTNMFWLIAMGFPFVGSYLIFYGAMMNIPPSYYEAAELDGISVWKRFIKIDIPLCIPQMKYVLIMTIIHSIQNFSRIYVAMGGMPGVVSTPIVEMYMLMNASERNYGLASAYATVLFVILFGMTYLSMRNRMKDK